MSEITYETIVGLEVHVQLKTDTKLFCRCSTTFGSPPNTQVCPVCLGQPGSLPVINAAAIDIAIRAGLGMNCKIASFTKWDRKNYFYPDLPKGYQISQFDLPICGEGYIEIRVQDDAPKKVRLFRAHLEEDAGKSLHDEAAGIGSSRIDLNRTGTPLLEIVSQPDIRSSDEAKAYLTELKMLMEFLDVSDCNMQEGSLRVDANVNLHIVEVKNLNSFRAVERAIQYEEDRQYRNWLETGLVRGQAPKTTVGWDDAKGQTIVQREKEDSADYRYFPDPDLVPITISNERIEAAQASMPELPRPRRERYESELGLRREDALTLCQQGRRVADYFEELIEAGASAKRATSWMLQDVLRTLNDRQIAINDFPLTSDRLAELLKAVEDGKLDTTRGRDVFQYLLTNSQSTIDAAIAALGITSVDSNELETICRELLAANPDVVAKVKDGNVKALGALVGQAKKRNSNADPRQVQEICLKIIAEG
jgi:aspartyl-tRNA(Asn)/glutamyl-tRNA(Gln) amidotransferase subunit B